MSASVPNCDMSAAPAALLSDTPELAAGGDPRPHPGDARGAHQTRATAGDTPDVRHDRRQVLLEERVVLV